MHSPQQAAAAHLNLRVVWPGMFLADTCWLGAKMRMPPCSSWPCSRHSSAPQAAILRLTSQGRRAARPQNSAAAHLGGRPGRPVGRRHDVLCPLSPFKCVLLRWRWRKGGLAWRNPARTGLLCFCHRVPARLGCPPARRHPPPALLAPPPPHSAITAVRPSAPAVPADCAALRNKAIAPAGLFQKLHATGGGYSVQ